MRGLAYAGGVMAIPRVLSIAGSDSGGGAGIQADLKAFARCGVHGMTAITAITVQNTLEVRAVQPVAPDIVEGQIAAVAEDIGLDAIKIGMLGSVPTIEAVERALRALSAPVPVVLDPVMIAESGGRLLDPEAERAMRELILPLTTVATPNVAEARVLADLGADRPLEDVARAIHGFGADAVIVTGGHRDEATDLLFDGERFVGLPGERYPDGAAHGSGCTHASVLAAHLAHGLELEDAARVARRIAGEAVRDGLREIGHGAGPVNVLGLGTGASGRPGGGSPLT